MNVIDFGVYTHVLGRSWFPLFEINDTTPSKKVIEFDVSVARKNGLPIGPHITKIKTSDVREILARGEHAIGNISSHHLLLSSFEMRELMLILYDISLNHAKGSNGENGTQTKIFKDGTPLRLICNHTLMIFQTTKIIQSEIQTLKTYDISKISFHMNDWLYIFHLY